MTRGVLLALSIALLHFAVTNVCAVIAMTVSSGPLSTIALAIYLGLSLPVLIYRALKAEALSLDLLSWKTETPINSIVFGVIAASVWFSLSKRGVRHRTIYTLLAIMFLVSVLVAYALNRDVV